MIKFTEFRWTNCNIVCLCISIIIAFSLLLHPISSQLGYESSLILSPVLSILSGLEAISIINRWKIEQKDEPFENVILLVFLNWLLLVTVPFLIMGAGTLIRGACDIIDGILFFILCPVGCSLIACCAGLIVSFLSSARCFPYIFFSFIVLFSLILDFVHFYFSPKVNIYDPLLGYFSGPLWDESISVDSRLVLYRITSMASLASFIVVFYAGLNKERKVFSFKNLLSPKKGILIFLGAAAVFGFSLHLQMKYGIIGSRNEMEKYLSKAVLAGNISCFLPPWIANFRADYIRREVLFRSWQLEKFFGGKPGRKMRLYFFDDLKEMKKFTGAGPTSVAKPWLGEAYIFISDIPPQALKHEMAHLYSAFWGKGLFKIPGKFSGLLVNTTLLEGVAVAADYNDEALSGHLTASAMEKAGLLKGWTPFSSAGFFNANKGVSYEAAGSFIKFVREKWGSRALHLWYSGMSFEEATGVKPELALNMWRKLLSVVLVPPELQKDILRLYSEPPIFKRRCPHTASVLKDRISDLISQGHYDDAVKVAEKIMKIDPDNPIHSLTIAGIMLRKCPSPSGKNKFPAIDRMLEKIRPLTFYNLSGDIAWMEGRLSDALEFYKRALNIVFDEPTVNFIKLKMWSVSRNDEVNGLMKKYLVCNEEEDFRSPLSRIAILFSIKSIIPEEMLIDYLIAKEFFDAQYFSIAQIWFDRVLRSVSDSKHELLSTVDILLYIGECIAMRWGDEEVLKKIIREIEEQGNLTFYQRLRLIELKERGQFLNTNQS